MQADIENGGAVTVETWAYPADKRLKEKQPFTWLGAAPYIAVVLTGALLFAAGMAVLYYGGRPQGQGGQDHQRLYVMSTRDEVGTALYVIGMVVAVLGLFSCSLAADEGCCECNLPRFEPD